MQQANTLAEIVEEDHPEFRVNKLYFDAYTKDRTGGNASYPDVEAALQKQLKNGLMVLNYTGHGNTCLYGLQRHATLLVLMLWPHRPENLFS